VLWLGTSRGLVFVKDGEAHDFNAIHGLPFSEVTSRASIHFNGRGDCFFGTTDGLIRFRPLVGTAVTPPRLEITSLSVDQKRRDRWTPPVRLRHDQTLAVSFKCLSFVNEQGNRYQFMLEGVDPGWGELTADDHVFYPYLPPGEITFRLRAFNSQGVQAAASPALRLVVVPPFTRTVWFYLLAGLCLLAVVGSFVGYKLHLDRHEKIKLRGLVSAKTAELQNSEEKYRELVEGSLIGIAILQEGRFVFVNSQIPKTFKYEPEEILGQTVEKFVVTEDQPLLRARLAERLRGDVTPHEFEIRVTASDQAVRTLLVHTNVTQFDGRPATLLNFLDTTDKQKMQEQIIHYQKLESIGTLAGGIAHDFNNILQGITGYSSLIRMQLPPESPLHRDLGMIEEASGKAAILTKKLLGFARKGKYLVVHFNLHEVIESVIALSRRTIPLNIEFVCRFASRPLSMLGDRSQMEQVFLNLFLNSRDAISGNGEIRVDTELFEAETDRDMGDHVLKQGAYIRVAVADTGSGIPPEVLPRIFDPFFTTKPQGKGSGLGLATVYGIVKNHHGYIYIESEPGRGARVEIYLPHSASPEGAPAPIRGTLPFVLAASRGMAGLTALIVDDEAVNRRFMTDLLRQAGMQVLEAENGQRAVDVFREAMSRIALVVLDINMPVMPGQHAMEQLLALRPDLPILVLSGYQEDAIVQEMIRQGAWDFLQKPVDAATLLAKIAALLEGPPEPAGN
jgi:PAS domain S-box-containing protein